MYVLLQSFSVSTTQAQQEVQQNILPWIKKVYLDEAVNPAWFLNPLKSPVSLTHSVPVPSPRQSSYQLVSGSFYLYTFFIRNL